MDRGIWWATAHGVAKSYACNAGDLGSIPGLGKATHSSILAWRIPWTVLENPRDGGAWWAAVYGVTQSRT